MFVLFLLTALGVVVLDEIGQYRSRQSMQMLKDHSLLGLRRIKIVSDAYGLDLVDTTFRVRNGLMTPERGVAVVEAARERIDSAWSAVASISHEPSERALFAQAEKARARADAAAEELHHILVSGDVDALSYFANHRLYPAIDPVTEALKRLSDQQLVEAEQIVRANLRRQDRFSAIRIALSALTLLIVGVIAHRILSNAYRGIESLAALAEGMRRHDFTATPRYRPRGELGEVMDDFVRMRSEVRAFEVELTEQLASNERVRDELQRREHFLSSLLSAAQAAIMAIDEQGRWIVFNPFAERLLGWRAEEVLGRVLRSSDPPRPDDGPLLATPGQIQATVELLESTLGRVVSPDWHAVLELAALQQAPGEWRLHDKNGQAVPVWMALSAFKDERGRQAGVIAVATDLSEIKQLESELRDSELRAREASEAKSSFLATMSHEIRTPMIGINGMVEVLSHTPLDTEQRHALNVIQASAEALLRIIGDILDFSKIEAGRLEWRPAAIDLRPLVHGIVAAFAGAASSKGLVLEARIDERVGPALPCRCAAASADPGQFRIQRDQVHGQRTVDILLEPADEPESRGRGRRRQTALQRQRYRHRHQREQRARLFEPFSQAESDTARRYGGTGLGLAICLRLAELMEGHIDMDSEPGRGTTIHLTVRLPRAAAAEVLPTPTQTTQTAPFASRRAPSLAEAEAAGALVLLIDDHPTNRIVISRQLALAGFACEVAEDGREGFERWRSGRYALLLSDVHMPGVDGYQLARMIREQEASEGPAHADRRPDRVGAERRGRTMPGGRHGRLPGQAGAGAGTGRAAVAMASACTGRRACRRGSPGRSAAIAGASCARRRTPGRPDRRLGVGSPRGDRRFPGRHRAGPGGARYRAGAGRCHGRDAAGAPDQGGRTTGGGHGTGRSRHRAGVGRAQGRLAHHPAVGQRRAHRRGAGAANGRATLSRGVTGRVTIRLSPADHQ